VTVRACQFCGRSLEDRRPQTRMCSASCRRELSRVRSALPSGEVTAKKYGAHAAVSRDAPTARPDYRAWGCHQTATQPTSSLRATPRTSDGGCTATCASAPSARGAGTSSSSSESSTRRANAAAARFVDHVDSQRLRARARASAVLPRAPVGSARSVASLIRRRGQPSRWCPHTAR